ncbi:unnamed protein product, partial [Leptidea sinapis]
MTVRGGVRAGAPADREPIAIPSPTSLTPKQNGSLTSRVDSSPTEPDPPLNNNTHEKQPTRQSPIVSTPIEQRSTKERDRERERERDRERVERDREERKERNEHASNRDSVVYNKPASPLDHRGANNDENKVRRHAYLQQLIYPLLNE